MKVAHTSTTSTDTPRASDDDKPVIPRFPGPRKPSGLGPRPTPPKQQLTADMAPLLRDIDWNGHIPSAPGGSFYGIETGTYTRTGTGYGALAADRAFGDDAA